MCKLFVPTRKTQIKQISINYHIYSQQILALSTAKWVVWEMQGEHFQIFHPFQVAQDIL